MNGHQLGYLILRTVLGISFFIHGLVKFQSGIGNTVGWFESIGLPGFLAYLVAIIELAGGLALVIGLGTRWVSALFAVIMAGAILKVKWGVGFLGNGQMAGWELDLAFLAMALYFVFHKSTALSVDSYFVNKKENQAVPR